MNDIKQTRESARNKLIAYKHKTKKSNSMIAQELKTSEHNIGRWLNRICMPQYAQALLIEASLPEEF